MGINKQKYQSARLEEYGISREESLNMHIVDETDIAVETMEYPLPLKEMTSEQLRHEYEVAILLDELREL
jgi:hypothetical protein